MEIMRCTVRRQLLDVDVPTLVALTYDYINVKATFSSEWAGMQKWLHVRNVENQSIIAHVLFNNDEIGEDVGLNLSAGEWDVWIHGALYEDNTLIKRITTNVKKIKVEPTGTQDEILPSIGPSVAEQAVAAAERAEAAADEAEDDAESARISAQDARNWYRLADQYAQVSQNYANQSRGYSEVAFSSATDAQNFATAAQNNANLAEEAVSHYPKIENDYWYVWDAANETWGNTNVLAKGTTFTPSVDGYGNLSWTNNAGLPNPPSVNLVSLFDSVPELQARMDEILAEAEAGVADIEEQRDTILASIAAAAQLGTDTTLTTSGMAADAKATGDAIHAIIPYGEKIDINSYPRFTKTINSGNSWNNISGSAYPVMIEIPNEAKIVEFDGTSGGIIAFLSSNSVDSTPAFASSYPSRISVSAIHYRYIVENDMNYMYVLKTSSAGTDVSITNLTMYYVGIDDSLSIEGMAADAKATGDMIAAKTNTVDTSSASDYSYLLSNVSGEKSRNVSVGEGWLDLPTQKGGIFFNTQYGSGHDLQIYIENTYGNTYNRIVRHTTRTVYRDWCANDGTSLLKVLVTGDSICRGGRNNGRGFIGDIGCVYCNIGIGGATLSNVHDSSASTDSVHPIGAANIPDTLVKYATHTADSWYIVPDVIIASGGINDLIDGAALGTVPTSPATNDTQAGQLNLSTVVGALGFLFWNMIKLYPNAHRFFLITNRQTDKPWTTSSGGYTQTELHDAIVAVCKLYGVDVIDVFNESMVSSCFSQYISPTPYSEDHSVGDIYCIDHDMIHPLSLGYKIGYVPLVREALKKAINT